MVGIGSEVKGHVKREQMEMVARGGRWTTVWEMESWGGGKGEKWEGQSEGKGGLPWVYIKPVQWGLPPWEVEPRMETEKTSLCMSEERELDVHVHASPSAPDSCSCWVWFSGSPPSPPSAFLLDLLFLHDAALIFIFHQKLLVYFVSKDDIKQEAVFGWLIPVNYSHGG